MKTNFREIIEKRAEKKFSSFLAAALQQNLNSFFPLDIQFPKVKSNTAFPELEAWVKEIRQHSKQHKGYGYDLEMKRMKSRINNFQTLPSRLFFGDSKNYLRFIGKEESAKNFLSKALHVIAQIPQLKPWIIEKPLIFLSHLDKWDDLIKVILYYQEHPQPNLYPRELPIEVHTKFVESNKGLIEQLLKVVILEKETNRSGEAIHERLSLKKPPTWFQIRLLDPEITADLGLPFTDFALPPDSLASISSKDQVNVFVIENRVTFLTFPKVRKGIAIWGKGFSVSALKGEWLTSAKLWYWGDLDAQGFQILAQFRSVYSEARSFLMDTETYQKFQKYSVVGTAYKGKLPLNLNSPESSLFQYLQEENNRLEQEHISQTWVRKNIVKSGLTLM